MPNRELFLDTAYAIALSAPNDAHHKMMRITKKPFYYQSNWNTRKTS